MEKVRKSNLDIARGIAIICIILGHLGIDSVNRVVFTLHAPVFYLIADYFFNSNAGVPEFLKKKARSLLVPYYLTCLAIIGTSVFRNLILHKSGTVKKLLDLLYAALYGAGDKYVEPFYIPAIGAIWFLWAMFWAECLLYLVLKVNSKWRVLIVAAIFAAGYYSRMLFWFPLSIQAGCCALLFLYIGYLVRKTEASYNKLGKEIKIALAIGAAVVWFLFIRNFVSFWLVHCDIGRGVIDIFGSLCACWCVVLISTLIDLRAKLLSGYLAFLGKYSLFILCAHIFEIRLFRWKQFREFLGGFGVNEFWQIIIVIIIKIIWSSSVAYQLANNEHICKLVGIKKHEQK